MWMGRRCHELESSHEAKVKLADERRPAMKIVVIDIADGRQG
jgi:hypothetical protein